MRTSMRMVLVGVLVASIVLFVGLLHDDGTTPDGRSALETGADDGDAEAPSLVGAGTPGAEQHGPVQETADTPTSASQGPPGQRWTLTVKVRPWVRPVTFMGYAGDDAEADPALEGVQLRVLARRRGAEDVALGLAEVDAAGTCTVDVSALSSLAPHARGATHLFIDPVEENLIVAPAPHRGLSDLPASVRYDLRCMTIPSDPKERHVELQHTILLHRGVAIRGRMPPSPFPRMLRVFVRVESSDGGSAPDVCADAEGRFVVPVWKLGTFDLRGMYANGITASLEDVEVNASIDVGALQVMADGASGDSGFGGRVRYGDGVPVVGIPVEASYTLLGMSVSWGAPGLSCRAFMPTDFYCMTDAHGRYRFNGVPFGGVSWMVGLPMAYALHTSPNERPSEGQSDLDFVVAAHRLRVRVVDAQGLPLPGVKLRARTIGAENGVKVQGVTTSEGGRADLWIPRGEAVRVAGHGAGIVPFTRETRAPEASNESTLDVVAESLDVSTGVRLRIEDASGSLRAGVAVRRRDGPPIWEGQVAGGATDVMIPPGEWLIDFAPAARGEGHRQFEYAWTRSVAHVRAGHFVEVQLPVERSAGLVVEFERPGDRGGRSLGNDIRIDLTPEQGDASKPVADYVSSWDETSHTVRHALRAGAWTLRVEATGYQVHTERVVLEAGKTTSISRTLVPED